MNLIDREELIKSLEDRIFAKSRGNGKNMALTILNTFVNFINEQPVVAQTPCYLDCPCEYQNPDIRIKDDETTLKDKVLSMRMNEFGFSKIINVDPNKDVFPNKIHIVKWEEDWNFAIGELKWNAHEPCWEFKSIGTRYLEHGTDELNKWILDFCDKYEVEDGELIEREVEEYD